MSIQYKAPTAALFAHPIPTENSQRIMDILMVAFSEMQRALILYVTTENASAGLWNNLLAVPVAQKNTHTTTNMLLNMVFIYSYLKELNFTTKSRWELSTLTIELLGFEKATNNSILY